jgi:signal transduction histidine kinase
MSTVIDPAIIHRLKNQLTVIVGFSELLLSELTEGERGRKDLTEIRHAARTAIDIVRELEPAIATQRR